MLPKEIPKKKIRMHFPSFQIRTMQQLCIETVRLLSETVDLTDTIIHSDQGSSYTSYDYRDYLLSQGEL